MIKKIIVILVVMFVSVSLIDAIFNPIPLVSCYAHAEYVQGYYRQDGTYVQGYYRTPADGNPYNNYNQPAPMDMRSPTTPGGYGSNPGYAPRIPNGGAAPRGGYDSNR